MSELTKNDIRSMFLWGALGGALPTVARIAGGFGANFDLPAFNILGAVLAAGLYALIGAVVARAVGSIDVKQCLLPVSPRPQS